MSGGFKFYHRPAAPPNPLSFRPMHRAGTPPVVARKCIVCGSTRPETCMKPFLLKGDHLNLWANNYFHTKRNKLMGFYAKIRYTLNPYACVAHFQAMPALIEAAAAAKNNKRTVQELVVAGEEPPSITAIMQRKPSPPPKELTELRTEKEVSDAILVILEKARAEMDVEEEKMEQLMKISRQVVDGDDYAETNDVPVIFKKKRKRVPKEKTEKPLKDDGNEADSDNSDAIDVEAIDSSEEYETTDSGGEESDAEVAMIADSTMTAVSPRSPRPSGSAPLPRPPTPARRRLTPAPPYRLPLFPRVLAARGAYSIGEPPVQRPPLENRPPVALAVVPKRLTLTAGTGKIYERPSWVAPNPGQHTLASVLQKFWNEDVSDSLLANAKANAPRKPTYFKLPVPPPPPPFGRTVIPGTKTRFIPASRLHPSLRPTACSPLKQGLAPRIRSFALLHHNPPLSPSRLIIGSEETVVTTESHSDAEEDDDQSTVMCSSSSSSSCSEESYVEVCDHSGERLPVEGLRIEEDLELKSGGTRSRSISTTTSSSEDSEMMTSSSEDEEDVDIDVETVDEASEKGGDKPKATVAPSTLHPVGTSPVNQGTIMDLKNGKKMKSAFRPIAGAYYRPGSKNRMIVQPSAVAKPATKLLSTGQYSLREMLKAQARAAQVVQPVRIDTRGMAGAVKRRNRPKDMPRLSTAAREERMSEWSRLEKVVQLKLAEQKAQLKEEKKRQQQNMIDHQLMADSPPPELDRVEEIEGGFPAALVNSLTEGAAPGKVLRLRFHKKEDEEVDVSKLKVLDPSTCPQGVARMEEVNACPSRFSIADNADGLSLRERLERLTRTEKLTRKERKEKKKEKKKKKLGPQVRNPLLIISKEEIMEMKQKMADCAPPPTPIVGIPDKKTFAARKEMYERKRQSTTVRAGLRFGRLKLASEAWTREKMMEVYGVKVDRGLRKEADDEEEDDQEDEALVAEMVEIVKMVKEEKQKNRGGETRMIPRRKMNEDDENSVLMLSDIDYEETEMEVGQETGNEKEGEEECEVEEIGGKKEEERKPTWKTPIDDEVMHWKSGGEADCEMEEVTRQKEVENEDEEESDTQTRRKSNVTVQKEVENEDEEEIYTQTRRKSNVALQKEVENEDEENDTQTRRKSTRLRLKREALPKSERKLIWKTPSDDDWDDDEYEPSPDPEPSEKRKRGRPRKDPNAPPSTKKQQAENNCNKKVVEIVKAPMNLDYWPLTKQQQAEKKYKRKMTEMEKEVLARVLGPLTEDEEGKENVAMNKLRKQESMKNRGRGFKSAFDLEDSDESDIEMERERGRKRGRYEDDEDSEDAPAQLERQQPKAPGDGPILPLKRRKMQWSWKQRLENDAIAEMSGRLCNYCLKHQKRCVWIPNCALALMDHARTHCVETLMCPNKECTYMNTQRSRISQHMSYVHKMWGMPIDLSEMYPPMRKSLMMRLRHCFPLLSTSSVCRICRVAVKTGPAYHRWHAQTHLTTQAFECSRNICMQKFSSEEDCLEHITKTNCRGSVVNGMTDEMEEELHNLVEQCFGIKECQQPKEKPAEVILIDEGPDGEADSNAPSLLAEKPSDEQIETEEIKEEEEPQIENEEHEEEEGDVSVEM